MSNKPWYKDWFNSDYYHLLYNNRNDDEAQFFLSNLTQYLAIPTNSKLLDVACGKGRHSITLSKMGFDVTGIDLSENSIIAAKEFETNNLHFFQHDMRKPFWINYFNYVGNFFTSFGYFRTQREHDNAIRTMAQSLTKEGKLIIDYLNVPFVEKTTIATENVVRGEITFHISKWHDEQHFFKQIQITDPNNLAPKHLYTEKVAKFRLGDFIKMFADYDLQVQEVFGNYALESYTEKTSPRLIMIAQKK